MDPSPDQTLIDAIRITYQPIVRLDRFAPVYLEVLARIADDDGQLRGPQPLVDAMTSAERSLTLSTHIIRRALAEHPRFTPVPPCTLAFNLPLDALLHPALMTRIEASRAAAGIAATHIQFELTETHPVTDLAAAGSAIGTLRGAGYHLALDDVTPATHNLGALLRLPIASFKLDQSVTNAPDAATHEFIRALCTSAGGDGKSVIAEGIETAATLDHMRALGVQYGQGFYFAAAMPAAAIAAYFAAREA